MRVKIGGGYGNIARRVDNSHIDENPGNSSINYSYTTSGYPRFTEAARYWLQWAGFPEKVYSPSQGKTTIPTITNAGENGSIIWQEVRTYCPTVQD